MTDKTGGPAFPVPDVHYPNGQIQYGCNGMTLRDYFAAEELAGIRKSMEYLHPELGVYERIASHCYKMADAMLKERTK